MAKMFQMKLQQAIRNLQAVEQSDFANHVDSAIDLLLTGLSSGRKLLVFGNGGSAADAQHICGELVGRFAMNRKPISAIALTTDTSILTAWSNDCGYDTVFARQVEAHGAVGDVAWALSTTGNSKNVVLALEKAREIGMRTLGLAGKGSGAMAKYCDVLLDVPLTATPEIQEVHVLTYHHICAELERRLFPTADFSI